MASPATLMAAFGSPPHVACLPKQASPARCRPRPSWPRASAGAAVMAVCPPRCTPRSVPSWRAFMACLHGVPSWRPSWSWEDALTFMGVHGLAIRSKRADRPPTSRAPAKSHSGRGRNTNRGLQDIRGWDRPRAPECGTGRVGCRSTLGDLSLPYNLETEGGGEEFAGEAG